MYNFPITLRYFLSILLLFLFVGCSPTLKSSFKKLSKPERSWVIWHPFKAKRAYRISLEAEKTKDSIQNTNLIGKDNNGGQLDAFKHSFWMARLSQRIGKRAAFTLGKAHEKGNYQTFLKRRLEDGMLPDKPSTDMDLYNNNIGISVGKQFKKASKPQLISVLIDSIRQGKMRVLLKDNNGHFLDCDKKRIPLDSLKHKWNTKKCLVNSNY